jgi:hypothetical protein
VLLGLLGLVVDGLAAVGVCRNVLGKDGMRLLGKLTGLVVTEATQAQEPQCNEDELSISLECEARTNNRWRLQGWIHTVSGI